MEKPLLLLVDDDRAVKRLLSETLEREGFLVIAAGNGLDALNLISQYNFDMILLDSMIPGLDGLEVCTRIRDKYPGPIVLISAQDRNADKVKGLNLGADDYITKPFEIEEVVSRVKAHLRRELRARSSRRSSDALLSFDRGKLVIHKDSFDVYLEQERVELSTKEFQILAYLAEQDGRTVSREEMYDSVWGGQDAKDIHTVTVHIKNLRAKIDSGARYIKTVWGSGYKFTGEKD